MSDLNERRIDAYGRFVSAVRGSLEEDYATESARIASLRVLLSNLTDDLLGIADHGGATHDPALSFPECEATDTAEVLPYATRKCRGHWHVTVNGEDLIGEYASQEAAQAEADFMNANLSRPREAPSEQCVECSGTGMKHYHDTNGERGNGVGECDKCGGSGTLSRRRVDGDAA